MAKLAPLLVILLIVVIGIFGVISIYNNLVNLEENVQNKLSQIDNQLQLRNDLIPNLVATVKGYAAHEAEILEDVTEARSRIEEMAEGDLELTGALSRLLVVVENYPDLKADANFRQLSDNLSGTENRIAVARRDYNETAREYNTATRRFPGKFIAGMLGFERVSYFEAEEGVKDVPQVDFSK